MINALFKKNSQDRLTGFIVKGHAGLADMGHDVCCASISSAVMMAVNTVTEVYKIKADVKVDENEIHFGLTEDDEYFNGDKILMGLLIHLYNMVDEFGGFVKVKVEDEP